jgi:hypothetical protein
MHPRDAIDDWHERDNRRRGVVAVIPPEPTVPRGAAAHA